MRRPSNAPRGLPWWLRLARYARPQWGALVAVLLLMIAQAALTALRPWPVKLIVDHVLTDRALPHAAAWIALLPGVGLFEAGSPGALLAWLAGLTVVVFLAGQGLTVLSNYLTVGAGQGMMHALGGAMFDHLQRLSLRFYGRRTVGDLIQRVTTDSACVRNLVMSVALSRVSALIRAAFMFSIMWNLNRSLALLVLLAAVPLGVISRLLNRPMMERAVEEQRLGGEMTALAEQTLTVLPVVQGFGREDHGDERFVSISRRTLQATLRLTMTQLQFQFGTGAVRAACTAGVMLVGGFHVLDGSLSVGGLLVFLAYLTSLYSPLEGLAYASVGFASAAASARRVLEVLDDEEMVRERTGARPLGAVRAAGQPRGHVRVDGVTFGYEPGRPVLVDVSLEASPGEMIALVGPTGAGKSTLVSLVPRFLDPWSGRVLVDGADVRDVELRSLRSEVALVLQEPFLLPLSVAENLSYGRPEATRAEVEVAARAANAHEFILRLPQGYDTVVGERGATLSGGERQRLSVARALVKDAPILILDEPTSALDVGTEALLLEALERLMVGRTVLVIAHRLSTVRRADRIIVLEQGRIVETGSHDELLAMGRAYAALYHAQHGGAAAAIASA